MPTTTSFKILSKPVWVESVLKQRNKNSARRKLFTKVKRPEDTFLAQFQFPSFSHSLLLSSLVCFRGLKENKLKTLTLIRFFLSPQRHCQVPSLSLVNSKVLHGRGKSGRQNRTSCPVFTRPTLFFQRQYQSHISENIFLWQIIDTGRGDFSKKCLWRLTVTLNWKRIELSFCWYTATLGKHTGPVVKTNFSRCLTKPSSKLSWI